MFKDTGYVYTTPPGEAQLLFQNPDLTSLFPRVTDPGAMWHLAYYALAPTQFFKAAQGHWNTLNDEQKRDYENIIGEWILGNVSTENIMSTLSNMGVDYAMWFVQNFLKADQSFNEWAHSLYIQKDFPRFIDSVVAASKTIPAEHVKPYLQQIREWVDRYAPEGWAEKVPRATAEKAYSWLYVQDEKAGEYEFNQAGFKMPSEGGKIFIGLLVGGFGLWGVSKLIGAMGKK